MAAILIGSGARRFELAVASCGGSGGSVGCGAEFNIQEAPLTPRPAVEWSSQGFSYGRRVRQDGRTRLLRQLAGQGPAVHTVFAASGPPSRARKRDHTGDAVERIRHRCIIATRLVLRISQFTAPQFSPGQSH
jgi:hypothetical protein